MMALRCYLVAAYPFVWAMHYRGTYAQIDSLMFGSPLAYANHYHREGFVQFATRWKRPLIAFGVTMLLLPGFMPYLTGNRSFAASGLRCSTWGRAGSSPRWLSTAYPTSHWCDS